MVKSKIVFPKEPLGPETSVGLLEAKIYSEGELEKRLTIPSEMYPYELGNGPKVLHAFRYNKRLREEIRRGGLAKEEAFDMLEAMMLGRELERMSFEIKYNKKYGDVKNVDISFPTHCAIGMEAMTVGSIFAIEPDDYITSTHRGHVDALVKGYRFIKSMSDDNLVKLIEENKEIASRLGLGTNGKNREKLIEHAIDIDIYRTIAELFGKKDGFCNGKGGGMHLAWTGAKNLGNNAIVGGLIGEAVGSGFASRYLKDKRVTLAIAGDGGYLNEYAYGAMNLATMAQLKNGLQSITDGVPVVFTCYNNQYAMGSQQRHEVTDVKYIAQKVIGWDRNGMHAEVAFGMDVLAVYDAIKNGAGIARSGDGPIFRELWGTRFTGHSLSDDPFNFSGKGGETCRAKDEILEWKNYDPISLFASQMVIEGLMTIEQFKEKQKSIEARVQRLAKLAWDSQYPDISEMYDGLYTTTTSDGEVPDILHIIIPTEIHKFKRDEQGRIDYSRAIREAIIQEMVRDKRIVVFGEDLAEYGGAFGETEGIHKTFGFDRIFNTSLNEANIAGVATGMALRGMRPIAKASMYIDFLTQALDQIANHAAKLPYMSGGQLKAPVVFWTDMGGGMGYAGQHSQNLESMVAMFPGLKVVIPATANDAKGLMIAAIRDDNPVVFIGHQNLYRNINCDTKGIVPEEPYKVDIGKANIVKEGEDITLISYSWMLCPTLKAVEMLEKEGYKAEVIDLRSLVPLDMETIGKSVEKTGRVVIAHQAVEFLGIGAEIAAQLSERYFDSLNAPIKRVGAPFCVAPCAVTLEKSYGKPEERKRGFIPGDYEIYKAAKEILL